MGPEAAAVVAELAALAQHKRAVGSARFFKTGPGEYGEGDRFIGVTVPNTRKVCKAHPDLSLEALDELLASEIHEHRLAACIVMATQYPKADDAGQAALYDFYLAHTHRINNWDLVDTSASRIVGPHLDVVGPGILDQLAGSPLLWERRIAIIAPLSRIMRGEPETTLRIAERLLGDPEPLIHKATGWMLREVGKRVGEPVLTGFLDEHAPVMPATALSYACEHLTPQQRLHYRALRKAGRR